MAQICLTVKSRSERSGWRRQSTFTESKSRSKEMMMSMIHFLNTEKLNQQADGWEVTGDKLSCPCSSLRCWCCDIILLTSRKNEDFLPVSSTARSEWAHFWCWNVGKSKRNQGELLMSHYTQTFPPLWCAVEDEPEVIFDFYLWDTKLSQGHKSELFSLQR